MHDLHKSDIRSEVIKGFLFQFLFQENDQGPISSQ